MDFTQAVQFAWFKTNLLGNVDVESPIKTFKCTFQKPLYVTVCYNTVFDTMQFKDGFQKYVDSLGK